MEPIASQQVFAAWVQAAGIVAAALIAALIYGLVSYRAFRRARREDLQYFDRLLMLAQQIRKLFHKAELACSGSEAMPAIWLLATFETERRCLTQALQSLPLEHAPDQALFTPVLKLSVCLTDMGEGPSGASRGDARQMFRRLHRRADSAIERIRSLRKLHCDPPRFPLKRVSEAGMPTTTVDRYATFKFSEEIYLEQDSVDFEILVNNQSVRCTVRHEELDRLAEASHLSVGTDFRRYATIFRQQRELIWLAAECLIRAGARSPVAVKASDVSSALSVKPSQRNSLEVVSPAS